MCEVVCLLRGTFLSLSGIGDVASRRIQEKFFPDGAASGSEGMEGEAEIASFQMQLIARRISFNL